LTLAREYAWPSNDDDDDDSRSSSSSSSSLGQEELGQIFQRLVDRYGHLKVNNDKDGSSSSSSYWDGTVWHWERSFKPDVPSGNVQYCGVNALMYAIARNL
jgi:hypothetical protein